MEKSSCPNTSGEESSRNELVVLSEGDDNDHEIINIQKESECSNVCSASKSEFTERKELMESPMSDVDDAIKDFVLSENEQTDNNVELNTLDGDKNNVEKKGEESPDSDVIIVMEDLKTNSDDECLILEDDSDEIVIQEDDNTDTSKSKVTNQICAGKVVNKELNVRKTSDKTEVDQCKNTLNESTSNLKSTSTKFDSSEISVLKNSVGGLFTSKDTSGIKSKEINEQDPTNKNSITEQSNLTGTSGENPTIGKSNGSEADSVAQGVITDMLDHLNIQKESEQSLAGETIESSTTSELQLEEKATNKVSKLNELNDEVELEELQVQTSSEMELTESKKRKNSSNDGQSTQAVKRSKDSGASDVEITAVNSVMDDYVMEKVSTITSSLYKGMVKTTMKHLDAIAMDFCSQAVNNLYKEDIERESISVNDLEKRLQLLEEDLLLFKLEANTLHEIQKETFKGEQYDKQIHTRTVGVNVRIVREGEVPHLPMRTSSNSNATQLPSPQQVSTPSPSLPLPRPQVQVHQQQFVQKLPVPQFHARNNASTPRVRVAAPNVTMTGNPLAMAAPGVTRAPQTYSKATTSRGLIDLTDDDGPKKTVTASSTVVQNPSTVSKVGFPPVANNQAKVLVPIGGIIHMLPNGQGFRQTVVPSTGFMRNAIRTCILPNNTTAIRGPVLPTSNSMQTTYFVQLNNTGSSSLRAVPSNNTRPTAPASNPLPSTSKTPVSLPSSSPLLLIPTNTNNHPAPFPPVMAYPPSVKLPPKPSLKISKAPNGIVLSWNLSMQSSKNVAISKYQLYAYQECKGPITSSLWKKVGDVDALPLPMACTLTQFTAGYRYYFSVRAVDTSGKIGPYCDPVSIMYTPEK